MVAVDLVAIVQNGRVTAFGNKHDIMTPGLQPAARTVSEPVPNELQTQVRRPA